MIKKFCLIILYLCISQTLQSQIRVNEIMYAPSDASNEWFELVNISDTALDLRNWKWKDATSGIRTITVSQSVIQPDGFVIVCQDSIKLKNQFPALSCKIFQTSWSTLNNTGDNLIIINSSNLRDDSVLYQSSWGGNSGYSLEKKIAYENPNKPENWGTSVNPSRATPGFENSLTPKSHDLLLKSFEITPLFPVKGDSLRLEFIIKNAGINAADNFEVSIYDDRNFDSIYQGNELLSLKSFQQLNQNDSLTDSFLVTAADTGYKQFITSIKYSDDDDTLNNNAIKNIYINFQTHSAKIIINEIMYAPVSSEPEWIEIFNSSGEIINVKNWKIADSASQNDPVNLTLTDKLFYPRDYLLITKSQEIFNHHSNLDSGKIIIVSSMPVLNNDKDKIFIYNESLNAIDYVSYRSSWGGNNGKSLERKSPESNSGDSSNWVASIDCERSTPLSVNSFNEAIAFQKGCLVINEIMYDPLTSGTEWIEFLNTSSQTINLNGWNLKDNNGQFALTDSCGYLINPGDYLVVAKDSNLYKNFSHLKNPELNQKIYFNKNLSISNDGEALTEFDFFRNIIDSVYFSQSWNNPDLIDTKGISLERINPSFGSNQRDNWNSSADINGGTPGKRNSIYLENAVSNSNVLIEPNPFSPDGDGFEDFTLIKYKLKFGISQMVVKVFDIKGRLVRTLINNQITGSDGTIIFDGLTDRNERLRIGIYIVLIEAVDSRGGLIEKVKTPVVIAAKL